MAWPWHEALEPFCKEVMRELGYGLADVARRVIQRMFHPRLSNEMESYDVASNICQDFAGPVIDTHFTRV